MVKFKGKKITGNLKVRCYTSHRKVLIPKTLSMYFIKNIKQTTWSQNRRHSTPSQQQTELKQWYKLHLILPRAGETFGDSHSPLMSVFKLKGSFLWEERGENFKIIPLNFRSNKLKTTLPPGLSFKVNPPPPKIMSHISKIWYPRNLLP